MPLIDMSLEELSEYEGRNPRPVDFDEYWERGLREMRSVDPNIELVPSSFQAPFADCFDLYFTGVRGARIHAKYARPKKSKEKHPAVVQFHGYSVNAGDWVGLLAYAARGYTVVAMDVRGQGGYSEDTGGVKGNTLHGHIIRGLDGENPDDLLFRHIFLDTAQLAGIVMDFPEVDGNRVAATGWSQGGGLTLACAALEPRIKKAAPVYPFLSDYKRVWEMDLDKDAYHELRTHFRFFDPQHKREEEIFTKLGYIDIQHLASRVQAEVMMGVGLMDTICPPSTQFAVFNKLKSNKSIEVYPDFAHEELPGLPDKIYQFLQF
ncbi:acetyl esterase [Alkalihalobacillus alcalophilus ATCC 27647 = CGMCC 1.3604]|uniref:Acetyl esterase n=1 Tax=Alkalihalobacillus alcalophilus ATCC 27647 = CGMCC 1.3604 TaxID=1218173 RepID=A0A094YWB7_ALKAL|nr:alpha/beta fold hydrolase [Alkalihalobacillus alcalophilus]KGA97802.1 acetyl esterase [Alkalihalobacillus alcalophilus ATCC 27647 = CGMCC 1.3604]MED1563787.1 alpha/beta fold hydrolase [Alkalihalobacillus alcalophilus]THG89714.1 acetyl esterase [Alkalihalobacillus alcalophilus ATCC 27647 = CGMCC 1.3604]